MKWKDRSEWENICIALGGVGFMLYLAARLLEQWDLICFGPIIMVVALVGLIFFYRRRIKKT